MLWHVSAVVAAESEDDAKKTHPEKALQWSDNGWVNVMGEADDHDEWTSNPDHVKVTLIGSTELYKNRTSVHSYYHNY